MVHWADSSHSGWLLSAQPVTSEHSLIDSGCGKEVSHMHSSCANSTIAIRSCTAYPTTCCKMFNPYRMPPMSDYWNAAVTPDLQKLHWLFVCWKVEFKLVCVVHQSLVEQTPSYLAADFQLTADTDRPQLRSASERICVVPRTHDSFGDRSFSALWLLCFRAS